MANCETIISNTYDKMSEQHRNVLSMIKDLELEINKINTEIKESKVKLTTIDIDFKVQDIKRINSNIRALNKYSDGMLFVMDTLLNEQRKEERRNKIESYE